jgi:hypothetical protein
VDQYTEGLPGAGGERPSSGEGSKSGESSPGSSSTGTSSGTESATQEGGSLPAQSARELKSRGKDGAAAAELAQVTGPTRDSAPTSDDSDSSGTGILLPLVLIGSLLAVVTLAVVRRRRPTAPD